MTKVKYGVRAAIVEFRGRGGWAGSRRGFRGLRRRVMEDVGSPLRRKLLKQEIKSWTFEGLNFQ